MPCVQIDFQLEKYNLGGKSKRPEVPVQFVGLGKRGPDNAKGRGKKVGQGTGKEIAIFRDKRAKCDVGTSGQGKKAQQEYERVMKRWEENVRLSKPEMPNYIISVDGLINDTALPGLDIVLDKREIQLQWKPMLQLFFRECERLRALKTKWQRNTIKTIRENNRKVAKGEKLMPADYPVSMAAAEMEMRKEIRRARLREHYANDEQMVWAIDSLKHFDNYGTAMGGSKAIKLNADLPGAGLGEKWFGSLNLVQELYLDEWSCMHRLDLKIETIRNA